MTGHHRDPLPEPRQDIITGRMLEDDDDYRADETEQARHRRARDHEHDGYSDAKACWTTADYRAAAQAELDEADWRRR